VYKEGQTQNYNPGRTSHTPFSSLGGNNGKAKLL